MEHSKNRKVFVRDMDKLRRRTLSIMKNNLGKKCICKAKRHWNKSLKVNWVSIWGKSPHESNPMIVFKEDRMDVIMGVLNQLECCID